MDCYQLQTLSSFSFGRSSVKPEEYVRHLIRYGYKGGGIADLNCVFGFPYLSEAAPKEGFKAIYGLMAVIKAGAFELEGELVILSETGYLNLIGLFNQNREVYLIDDLAARAQGLALILKTEPDRFKDIGFLNEAEPYFERLSSAFASFYFGIEIYTRAEAEAIDVTRRFAREHSYKTIAFPKVAYCDTEKSYQAYLMLNAIIEKKTIGAADLTRKGPFFLLTPHALGSVYAEDEIKAQSGLAAEIDFGFMRKRGEVLSTGLPDAEGTLRKETENGLRKILGIESLPDDYAGRLNYELGVIHKMGFDDYFLIVSDYVRFAKENGIKVGPGRGSAAGSLVSYALNITEIDPIKYNLYFERFLNPLRTTMPDIDIDFEDDKRTEVIEYLKRRYGPERVALIVTFSTMQLRASIRNVGTIFNMPSNRIDSLAKSISPKSQTFAQEISSNYRFRKLASDDYYKDIIGKAELILDYPLTTSIHASGVILSERPLKESVPVLPGETEIAGYEYKTLEAMGFLKMDILALSYLTFLSNIEKNIKASGLPLPDIRQNLADRKSFEVLNRLQLTDIFQLESPGIQRAVREIRPTDISDISAILALYRPGPMGSIRDYANRKNLHLSYTSNIPLLDGILKDTYGIILYQEQILEIAGKIAGFDGGKADLFRRAISKKDMSKMASLKDDFISGSVRNGVSRTDAQRIFNLISEFANYGFNKSHSYAYAMITYALLYYKANYPSQFYLASLRKTSISDEKFQKIYCELHDFSYTVVNPSINTSTHQMSFAGSRFTVGFDQIKGFSAKLGEAIIGERTKRGPFASLGDFFRRTDLSDFTEKELDNMVNAGCFDEFGYARPEIVRQLENLKVVFKFAGDQAGDELMPYIPKAKPARTVDEFIAEFLALGAVLSFELKDLIKGERKYGNLYLVASDPIVFGERVRLDLLWRFGRKTLYAQAPVKVSKYDIISVNEDRSGHYRSMIAELHKEELK